MKKFYKRTFLNPKEGRSMVEADVQEVEKFKRPKRKGKTWGASWVNAYFYISDCNRGVELDFYTDVANAKEVKANLEKADRLIKAALDFRDKLAQAIEFAKTQAAEQKKYNDSLPKADDAD